MKGEESKELKERKMAKCGIWSMESRVEEGKMVKYEKSPLSQPLAILVQRKV
jgi:hypothetical protein